MLKVVVMHYNFVRLSCLISFT